MKKSLGIFFIVISIIIQSCSSSTETSKEDEERDVEKTTPPKYEARNLEELEREYIRTSNIRSIEKISFDYNSDGQLINREKISTINHDRNGFIKEIIIYDKKGNLQDKFSYSYDDKGVRIETKRYNEHNKLEKIYDYEYDRYGNKTKSTRYDINKNMEKYYTYNYDRRGNLIEENWYDASGEFEYRIEYEYDDNNKTAALSYDEGENLIFKYVFFYDQEGNVVEEVKYNSDGDKVGIVQYIYKYF